MVLHGEQSFVLESDPLGGGATLLLPRGKAGATWALVLAGWQVVAMIVVHLCGTLNQELLQL